MSRPDRDALIDAYLGEVGRAGISVRRETAVAMVADRIARFAAGVGIAESDAAEYYSVSTVTAWAREAGAQLHDEQPTHPLVDDRPSLLVPLGLLAECIAALVETEPALARSIANELVAYPAILLGGLAVVRGDEALLAAVASALLLSDPSLARRLLRLSGPE